MLSKHRRCKMIVDPKPGGPIYKNPYIITPNWSEALELTGYKKDTPKTTDNIKIVGRALYQLYQSDYGFITLSEAGIAVFHKSRLLRVVETCARSIVDVSGAGDTVLAAIVSYCVNNKKFDPIAAAELANRAAAIVISKPGTSIITQHRLANG